MTTSTSRPVAPTRRRARALRVLGWAFAAAGTALAAAVLLPDLVGLDRYGKVIQLVSFRPQLLAAAAVGLVLLYGLLWFRRGVWPLVAGLTAVLLLAAAMVLPRAVPGPEPTAGRPLTVLSFNVYEGNADVTELAALVRAQRPDLIALPEAGSRFARRLAPLLEPLGYHLHWSVSFDTRDVGNVVLAVADRLGPVAVQPTDAAAPFPYVQVSGGELGELRFAAVHTQAPVAWAIPRWKSDLALLRQWCAGPTPAIVAGDLNATLDHSALRAAMAGCSDAAEQRGEGLVPTWGPSDRTRAVGPQIDHVLATAGIGAQTFSVHALPGSDHRAILTRLLVS